jgi:hypothetical protein
MFPVRSGHSAAQFWDRQELEDATQLEQDAEAIMKAPQGIWQSASPGLQRQ